jgi:hypothetical protein
VQLSRAIEVASQLARLSPLAFAQAKEQIRLPVSERSRRLSLRWRPGCASSAPGSPRTATPATLSNTASSARPRSAASRRRSPVHLEQRCRA